MIHHDIYIYIMIRQEWILGWSHTFQTNLALHQHRGLPAAAHSRIAEGHGVRLAEILKRLTCRSASDRNLCWCEDCPSENGARTKALSIFPDRCAADLVHPPAIGGLPISCVPWAALGRGLDVGHCPGLGNWLWHLWPFFCIDHPISGFLNRS